MVSGLCHPEGGRRWWGGCWCLIFPMILVGKCSPFPIAHSNHHKPITDQKPDTRDTRQEANQFAFQPIASQNQNEAAAAWGSDVSTDSTDRFSAETHTYTGDAEDDSSVMKSDLAGGQGPSGLSQILMRALNENSREREPQRPLRNKVTGRRGREGNSFFRHALLQAEELYHFSISNRLPIGLQINQKKKQWLGEYFPPNTI